MTKFDKQWLAMYDKLVELRQQTMRMEKGSQKNAAIAEFQANMVYHMGSVAAHIDNTSQTTTKLGVFRPTITRACVLQDTAYDQVGCYIRNGANLLTFTISDDIHKQSLPQHVCYLATGAGCCNFVDVTVKLKVDYALSLPLPNKKFYNKGKTSTLVMGFKLISESKQKSLSLHGTSTITTFDQHCQQSKMWRRAKKNRYKKVINKNKHKDPTGFTIDAIRGNIVELNLIKFSTFPGAKRDWKLNKRTCSVQLSFFTRPTK